MKTLAQLSLLSFLIVNGAVVASAERPGQHPAYMHAMADLEEARARLEKPAANERREAEKTTAANKITDAIEMIKHAAADDGKDLRNRQPVDIRLDEGHDRLLKVEELLDAALRDVSTKEDNRHNLDLQARIIDKIREALHIVGELQRTRH